VDQTIAPGAAVTPVFTGKSAVSWPAIFAGAVIATAATLILMVLGSGVGLASISPWSNHGVAVTTFAVTGAIWLILTQWISAGLGGYIAGRLRTRWVGTHTHEVFFRDTAHGLITWAVATVFVAILLSSSVKSGVGAAGGVLEADRAHLVDQAAARAGVSQAEAQARVDAFIASLMQAPQAPEKLKADADAARKAAAKTSIFLALSMLVGAFIASVAAALGGRLRDEHI